MKRFFHFEHGSTELAEVYASAKRILPEGAFGQNDLEEVG